MNGITIIEEYLCRVVELPSLIATGVFFTLLCVGILAFYRWAYKDTERKSTKILILCCSIGIVVMCVALWAVQICNYNKTHYEYVVEVDDSVAFNDFFDRYEIVSVDGDRYRVKER
jgi:hypothetical protein